MAYQVLTKAFYSQLQAQEFPCADTHPPSPVAPLYCLLCKQSLPHVATVVAKVKNVANMQH